MYCRGTQTCTGNSSVLATGCFKEAETRKLPSGELSVMRALIMFASMLSFFQKLTCSVRSASDFRDDISFAATSVDNANVNVASTLAR